MAARAASPDTSANSGSAFHAPRRGSSSSSGSSSSAHVKLGASSSASDAPGAPARDMSQIKRLSYLLDAREARVQMVLDEAMSWLITPFAPAGVEGADAGPGKLQSKDPQAPAAAEAAEPNPQPQGGAGAQESAACAASPACNKDVAGENTMASAQTQRLNAPSQGDQGAASQPQTQQTQAPLQPSADVQTPNQLLQEPSAQAQPALPAPGPREEPVAASGSEASVMPRTSELKPTGAGSSLLQAAAIPKDEPAQACAAQVSQQASDSLAPTPLPAPECSPRPAATDSAQSLSEGAASFSVTVSPGKQAPAVQAEDEMAASGFDGKNSLFLRDLSFFSLEELEKLEAESAWDELDADDERYAGDYYLPLLPKLVAASSPSLTSGSRLDQLKSGDIQATPASSLTANATGTFAGTAIGASAGPAAAGAAGVGGGAVDSPKRKRGRPKGSGKKAKARLEAAATGTLPSGPGSFKGLEHSESSVFLQAGGSSPGLAVGYDSQSPGSSSALTNSPTSMWPSGADTFHSLADLLDISADSSGLPGASSASLASPATPSSGASNMLRSYSTASSAGSAMLPVPEDGPRSSLPLVSPRTSARSARLNSGAHARRLMFGVEEEANEAVPIPAPPPALAAAPKDSKKSSKGKTGRPRGRPRKIRPHERVRPAGEQA